MILIQPDCRVEWEHNTNRPAVCIARQLRVHAHSGQRYPQNQPSEGREQRAMITQPSIAITGTVESSSRSEHKPVFASQTPAPPPQLHNYLHHRNLCIP